MAPIRVVVSGTGKMGSEILAAVARDPDLQPVGVLEKFSTAESTVDPASGEALPQAAEPDGLFARVSADVVIDFTNAAWTPVVALSAIAHRVRPVIGTSSLPREFIEELGIRAEKARVGAFIAPNFAIGAVLMMHMAKIAAPFFDSAEIIELHHDQKVDSPSGTAEIGRASCRERV